MAKVLVNLNGNRLRLVFRPPGSSKRKFLYLGMEDTPLNRTVAEGIAKQIEGDIVTNNFDPTLNKYRNAKDRTDNKRILSIWDQYRNYKAQRVSRRSLEKYDYTRPNLLRFFGDRTIVNLSRDDADDFARFLIEEENLSQLTAKQRLSLVKGCWEWALEQELVTKNPWRQSLELIKVPPKKAPTPFTREEVQIIIAGFRKNRYYNYYTDFMRWQFGCGARFGESAALRWEHITPDCDHVWIGESYSRGDLGPTKTNEQREFDLPESLSVMLMQRKGNAQPTDLVFPAPNGGHMNDRNFRNRAWKKVLEDCNIPYRKPYITRSTFISHCSGLGWSPADIADITGHDPEILIRHYLGGIQGTKKAPEMPYSNQPLSDELRQVKQQIDQLGRSGKSWENLHLVD